MNVPDGTESTSSDKASFCKNDKSGSVRDMNADDDEVSVSSEDKGKRDKSKKHKEKDKEKDKSSEKKEKKGSSSSSSSSAAPAPQAKATAKAKAKPGAKKAGTPSQDELPAPVLAAYAACLLTRRFSVAAFGLRRRAMTAPDLIDAIGEVFEEFSPAVAEE